MEELKNVNAENVQENSMKEEYKCIKCGTILKDGQEFCPKCGTKKGDINNKKCQNCGEIVEPGEKFCHKCGAKIKLDITSDVLQEAKKFKISKKQIKIDGSIILAVILIVIFATSILPKMTISYKDLMAEGKFTEAYSKAKKEEKQDVLDENLIAYFSKDLIENLKDPTSFHLNRVYKTSDKMVMLVNAKNSYGASVLEYYYYTYDDDDKQFEYYCSFSSLEEERIYTYADDYDEKLEKILKNAARLEVKGIMQNESNRVSDEIIEGVNNLFQSNILKDVELLPDNNQKDKL